MKADLTRDTFHPFKHFTRVLMQQGRVQLDADLNEQASILQHYLRTLAADLIGPAGSPDSGAFQILPITSLSSPITPAIANDFRIGAGHYYVDGILCEAEAVPIKVFALNPPSTSGVVQVDSWRLDGAELQDAAYSPQQGAAYLELFDDVTLTNPLRTPAFPDTLVNITNFDRANGKITIANSPNISAPANPKLRRIFTYLHQPNFIYSNQSNNLVPPPLPALGAGVSLQIYLDVWERVITYIEDHSIREVALGGPDTAVRTQLIWQVKTTPALEDEDCMTPPQLAALFQWENRGRLKARAKQSSVSTDPCIISPNARYQGPENQLYRVEINRGGPAWDGADTSKGTAATFKWSRENGSVAFPIAGGGKTNNVVLETLGRDDRFGLTEGDWVEVQDDNSTLLIKPGTLLQVQAIDPSSMAVTLDGTPDPTVGGNLALHPLLRRWDLQAGDPVEGGLTLANDNAALVVEGTWLELEDGVQVFFQPASPVQPVPQGAITQIYRTADYWLIPARTATGDVEWPRLTTAAGNLEVDANGNSIPITLPPHGVHHHYAPIAVIGIDAADGVTQETNCRTFTNQDDR
jgi:hypothetical protein